MPDFPNPVWPPLNTVTPHSWESLGPYVPASLISGAMGQDIVRYYPFRLYQPATVFKMSLRNGSTVNGSVDLGVYDAAGNKLVSSGLTAQSGGDSIQTFDVTDTLLLPGKHYMACKSTSATGTFQRTAIADELLLSVPLYVETTGAAAALPTTWSPAITTDASVLIAFMCVHFNVLV